MAESSIAGPTHRVKRQLTVVAEAEGFARWGTSSCNGRAAGRANGTAVFTQQARQLEGIGKGGEGENGLREFDSSSLWTPFTTVRHYSFPL